MKLMLKKTTVEEKIEYSVTPAPNSSNGNTVRVDIKTGEFSGSSTKIIPTKPRTAYFYSNGVYIRRKS